MTSAAIGFGCVAGADLEPDGRAGEAEGVADLVFEEALVGEVQFHLAVGEEDEGRRSDGGLRHVVDPDLFRGGNGGALEVDALEEAVHLAGGDALAALRGDERDGLIEAVQVGAVRGGEEDDGRVVEILEDVAHLLFEDVRGPREACHRCGRW